MSSLAAWSTVIAIYLQARLLCYHLLDGFSLCLRCLKCSLSRGSHALDSRGYAESKTGEENSIARVPPASTDPKSRGSEPEKQKNKKRKNWSIAKSFAARFTVSLQRWLKKEACHSRTLANSSTILVGDCLNIDRNGSKQHNKPPIICQPRQAQIIRPLFC